MGPVAGAAAAPTNGPGDKSAKWSTCVQNAHGTNTGEQKVEAVQLQEAPQQEKIQVNLAGRSMTPVGQQERFQLLSERGYPTGTE